MGRTLAGLLIVVVIAGCGTGLDHATSKAYDICLRTGYFSEDDVNRLFVTTEITRDSGVTKLECALASTEGCSTWDNPNPCNNCAYAIIDAVYGY